MVFIKHRHSQHSIERNAIYKKPVSDLSESRDCYIYECLNLICYHLRAATKIWKTVHVRKNTVIEATCPVTVYQSDEAKIFLEKSYGLLYLANQPTQSEKKTTRKLNSL